MASCAVLDDSVLSASDDVNCSTLSETLLSTTSPSSPASSKMYMRNIVAEYIDEIHSLIRNKHEIRAAGLPLLYDVSVQETLDGVTKWMEADDPSEMDLRLALERLEEEMATCGVSLYLEVYTRDARKRYREILEAFTDFVHKTMHKTGDDQPFTEHERVIITDFIALEKRWAERPDSIIAQRREFVDRTRMIRELWNNEQEDRVNNENIAGVILNFDDGSKARIRRLYQHVGHRAALLRNTPKDNLSLKQRRSCKSTATRAMLWLDNNRDNADKLEQLQDYLQQICQTTQETSAASEIVERRNELDILLAFIESALNSPPIVDALGADRAEAVSFVLHKANFWLENNVNPSIQTLEKFVESLRVAASKYGLTPPTLDDPVPQPASVAQSTISPTSPPLPTPESAQLSAQQAEKVLVMNIACVLLEELHVLRVACAAADAQAYISSRIAPLQVEVEDVLNDPMALKDGAAPLLRRYKLLLTDIRTTYKRVAVPASCWAHVLPFEAVELDV